MQRYVAFLRGVSPLNASMPALKRALERGGFADVRTLLSSGNVVFSIRASSERAVARRAQAAMLQHLGKSFLTFVRPLQALEALLASEPYARFKLEPGVKRVVTFLSEEPKPAPKLPIQLETARILRVQGREVFSVYMPGPRGPVFMALLEKTFGKNITTRTWDTVSKAARRV